MPIRFPKLWSAAFTARAEHVQNFAEVFENSAEATEPVSVSIFNPPRQSLATTEAIFNVLPDKVFFESRISLVAEILGTEIPDLIVKEVRDLDWLHKVASDFPPLRISRWVIHGAAHTQAAAQLLTKHRLRIDATSAFGTGEHPTTHGCLLMLDQLIKRASLPDNMLDMGCGTAILSMAFAKATHRRATAVDIDKNTLVVACENARLNGLQKNLRLGLSRGYQAGLVRRQAPYDLIMANIFARPLAHMAHDLKKVLRPGGYVILAGLLSSQSNMVLAAHRAQGIYLVERQVFGEWTILLLRRPCRTRRCKAE